MLTLRGTPTWRLHTKLYKFSLRGRRTKEKEGEVKFEREVRGERKARSLGSGVGRLQGRYWFFRVLRPPDERKNPDWSELIKIT